MALWAFFEALSNAFCALWALILAYLNATFSFFSIIASFFAYSFKYFLTAAAFFLATPGFFQSSLLRALIVSTLARGLSPEKLGLLEDPDEDFLDDFFDLLIFF